MGLTDPPRANRLHIGIFGKRNSGKSSLTNALTGQEAALVSDVAGTTTDPVYKAMEVHGIGPCVFIDTAGFDDEGQLGGLRVERTQEAARKTDVALLLFSDGGLKQEAWAQEPGKGWRRCARPSFGRCRPILNRRASRGTCAKREISCCLSCRRISRLRRGGLFCPRCR